MRKTIVFSLFLFFALSTNLNLINNAKQQITYAKNKPGKCELYGDIQLVTSFPDVKVQIVESFPDIEVKIVDSFPDKPGKWKFVSSFPDYKVQIVTSFPDYKIKFVDSFPGCK